MNTTTTTRFPKSWLAYAAVALVAGAATLSAPSAQAGSFSVQIGVPAPYYYPSAPVYGGYYGYAPAPVYGTVYNSVVPVYGSYGSYYNYAPVGRTYGHQRRRDMDRDGIPDRVDRDRDGDGVPNRFDRRPNNPRRN